MKNTLLKNTKILYGIIALLLLVALGIWGVFWYEKYQVYKAEKQVDGIHAILDTSDYTRDNCENILSFQSEKVDTERGLFRVEEYNSFKENCDQKYNIARQEQSLEFCEW